jgi:hypothetical protein
MPKIKLKLSILALLIGGALLIIGYNFIYLQREKKVERELIEESVYQIGGIRIDTEKREIYFKGRVSKDKGWVQFLVYTRGYKWLEKESAITSEVELADLQKAIALLDWRIWDDLWYRRRTPRSKKVLLFLQWREKGKLKKIQGAQAVIVEEGDFLGIEDLVFLGSPYFDPVALEASSLVDCSRCPIFPLEEKALREEFIRESGRSGYRINSDLFPSRGKEVLLLIKI